MKRVLSLLLVLSVILAFPLSAAAASLKEGQRVSATVETKSSSVQVNGVSYREQAKGVFDIVNIRRKEAGLHELEWNENIVEFALLRGLESIVSFSHTRPDGREWYTVGSGVNGENLAYGDTHYADVMEGWMNSPSHRENILDKDFKSLAVACIEAETGNIYWVQLFSQYTESGMPKASFAASEPTNEIVELVQNAIASTDSTSVTLKVRNVGSIAATDMAKIVNAAQSARKTVLLYADTLLSGDAVTGRMYVEPTKFGSSVANLQTGIHVDSEETVLTEDFFAKWFQNKVSVVGLEHQGSFGQSVHIAAKVDISGLNTDSLIFYAYDKNSNKYTRIAEPNYSIDPSGYLHFYTPKGGDIVITDRLLASR